MNQESELISSDILAYLQQHERKELLRLITCGSVDDGKSTLIGRLLYDSKMIYEDQLRQLESDSVKHGTTGGGFDPALLTDGLRAEREQGITIDVAYRYFSTARRKFIIADTPGHEQYTRNMATGASTADLAVILIDARYGVQTQTRRHSFIVSLLGIRHMVVTINKMDLVGYDQQRFEEICQQYRDFASRLDLPDVHFIPISALNGDNVVDLSPHMPWYQGSTLMHLLETVYTGSDRNLDDFRFPVQYVNRPHLDYRGFCGTVASGIVRSGDEIMVLPSKQTSRVAAIMGPSGELPEAFAGQAVTLLMTDEIDCSRGNMIVRSGNVPRMSHRLDATIVWMDQEPMVPGTSYLLKHTSHLCTGMIESLRYRVDVNTLHRSPAPSLKLNEIGRCGVTLTEPWFFDGYRRNRVTGAFIIIDRITNSTVGAGMISDRDSAKPTGDHWESERFSLPGDPVDDGSTAGGQVQPVTPEERAARFGQKPCTLLLTGLSGSGKTTVALGLERALFDRGRGVAVLDGQQIREGMNHDLGFSVADRSENLRRSAHLARFLNQAGLICVAAFVAPSQAIRDRAAQLIGLDQMLVVHVKADLAGCQLRDTRGHYAAAARGELSDFPGVSAPYEPPADPDLVLDMDQLNPDQAVSRLVELLEQRGFIA